jgi:hypothetical protein
MIEFEQICSRELLMKKAAEIEKTISVKEHKRERHDFGLTTFHENRFWNRRPDGIGIDKNDRTQKIHRIQQSLNGHLIEMKIFHGKGR